MEERRGKAHMQNLISETRKDRRAKSLPGAIPQILGFDPLDPLPNHCPNPRISARLTNSSLPLLCRWRRRSGSCAGGALGVLRGSRRCERRHLHVPSKIRVNHTSLGTDPLHKTSSGGDRVPSLTTNMLRKGNQRSEPLPISRPLLPTRPHRGPPAC